MDQLPVQVLKITALDMKSVLRCLALLIVLSSCEQVIEPDLPEHSPRLVLHAFFTADGIWTAYVGRSAGILESRPSMKGRWRMPRWSCWRETGSLRR